MVLFLLNLVLLQKGANSFLLEMDTVSKASDLYIKVNREVTNVISLVKVTEKCT